MTRVRLDKLRRMSRQEWHWRVREALHRLGERARVRTVGSTWNRADIRTVLAESARQACTGQIARRDWNGVQQALLSLMTQRQTRFVLDPSRAPAMRAAVLGRWPGALQSATTRADRILDGRFDLLGYEAVHCARGGRIDWHSDPVSARTAPHRFYADVPFLDACIGDHKVIWELNRHQHWLLLGRAAWLSGDTRYAMEIVAELSDWLARNPPLIGINWASMLEIGFRTLSWTCALHFLLGQRQLGNWTLEGGSSPWLMDMLIAVDRQLTHVEHHLSHYFSPNTHLTGEALALYVVGTALPELARSQHWINTGRAVLLNEIERQILPDGGHVERSSHYQRYTLDFYLLATQTARLSGDVSAARAFETATHRLADFTLTLADPNGVLPRIGDDDGGMLWPMTGRACHDARDSLALAAVVLQRPELAPWGIPEEVAWLAGPEAIRFTTSNGARVPSRLLPDTGYFVSRGPDGSHALIDAGPHGYLNGGHAHADALSLTLSLDGRALLIDPGTSTYTMDSQLRDRMRSSISHNTVTINGRSQSVPAGPFHWHFTVDARVVDCRTNPLFDWIEATHEGYAPARHRRSVVRTVDSGWLVVDVIEGPDDRVDAAAHWHFDPAWQVVTEGPRVRADHRDGATAWMLCAGGDICVARGDPGEGGWCAPVYGQLIPTHTVRFGAAAKPPVTLVTWIGSGRVFTSPTLRCVPLPDATIVEIIDGERAAVFMVRSASSYRAGGHCSVGEYETDAVILHYATDHGRLRYLIAQGIERCPHVRINGRDLPLSANAATDTLLIHGSDCQSFSAGKPSPSAVAETGAAFARH